MKRHFISAIVCLVIFCFTGDAYGHGGSSEFFPPVELNGKQVTLEVASLEDPDIQGQQISFSFLDFDSKITIRDVTFHIKAERGSQFLFEREFTANNGILVFDFISNNGTVTLEEAERDFFSSLVGLDSKKILVYGEKLDEGGLYKFDVSILTADDYSIPLEKPLTYDVGISIPQTTSHEILHPDYGSQIVQTITYYDELSEFEYNYTTKEISFSMPFDWSKDNIEKTSVVHQELVIPREFGELLVSGFSMYVNDIKLSDNIVTVDDFDPQTRTIHFIINQQELLNVFKSNKQQGMNFVIQPISDDAQLSAVTQNGQFRVLVSWEPVRLKSGTDAVISFDITDVFLKNRPVATNYDFSITYNGMILYQYSGTSTDSKDKIKFFIPDGTSGIIHLNFDNLDDNSRAATSFPIIVDSVITLIPEWIKESAGWWAAGHTTDETFLNNIEFLIQNDIISISTTSQTDSISDIPFWIKESAGWWAAGHTTDETFIQSLEFLIENGIIQI